MQFRPLERGPAGLRRERRGSTRAWAVGALFACAGLAGCAGDTAYTLLAEPGKYNYHSCQQLASIKKGLEARQRELVALMDRAGQGVGGTVVGALAYRSDYYSVSEELRVLETAAREKDCNSPTNWRSNGAIQ